MNPWPLDAKFIIALNADVLAFIARENPSAHSDVASVLIASAEGLSDVRWYCPDNHAYAYVALHTGANRIFAIAFGMKVLAYRLAPEAIPTALSEGTSRCAEIGADWITFAPWPNSTTAQTAAPDLKRWCKIAHDYVTRL